MRRRFYCVRRIRFYQHGGGRGNDHDWYAQFAAGHLGGPVYILTVART